LRRFRPAYVREMLQKRQGSCENCPHEVIDSRDLKFHRNVCGYWFRPEDDSFIWRSRIPLARAGLAEVACFTCLFGLLSLLFGLAPASPSSFWILPFILCLSLCLFTLFFFRDPRRKIPADPNVLLSPADGTVTHVEEVDEPDFLNGRALRISIFLSI